MSYIPHTRWHPGTVLRPLSVIAISAESIIMLESARAERQCECKRSRTPIRICISDRIVPGCEARLNRAESAVNFWSVSVSGIGGLVMTDASWRCRAKLRSAYSHFPERDLREPAVGMQHDGFSAAELLSTNILYLNSILRPKQMNEATSSAGRIQLSTC